MSHSKSHNRINIVRGGGKVARLGIANIVNRNKNSSSKSRSKSKSKSSSKLKSKSSSLPMHNLVKNVLQKKYSSSSSYSSSPINNNNQPFVSPSPISSVSYSFQSSVHSTPSYSFTPQQSYSSTPQQSSQQSSSSSSSYSVGSSPSNLTRQINDPSFNLIQTFETKGLPYQLNDAQCNQTTLKNADYNLLLTFIFEKSGEIQNIKHILRKIDFKKYKNRSPIESFILFLEEKCNQQKPLKMGKFIKMEGHLGAGGYNTCFLVTRQMRTDSNITEKYVSKISRLNSPETIQNYQIMKLLSKHKIGLQVCRFYRLNLWTSGQKDQTINYSILKPLQLTWRKFIKCCETYIQNKVQDQDSKCHIVDQIMCIYMSLFDCLVMMNVGFRDMHAGNIMLSLNPHRAYLIDVDSNFCTVVKRPTTQPGFFNAFNPVLEHLLSSKDNSPYGWIYSDLKFLDNNLKDRMISFAKFYLQNRIQIFNQQEYNQSNFIKKLKKKEQELLKQFEHAPKLMCRSTDYNEYDNPGNKNTIKNILHLNPKKCNLRTHCTQVITLLYMAWIDRFYSQTNSNTTPNQSHQSHQPNQPNQPNPLSDQYRTETDDKWVMKQTPPDSLQYNQHHYIVQQNSSNGRNNQRNNQRNSNGTPYSRKSQRNSQLYHNQHDPLPIQSFGRRLDGLDGLNDLNNLNNIPLDQHHPLLNLNPEPDPLAGIAGIAGIAGNNDFVNIDGLIDNDEFVKQFIN